MMALLESCFVLFLAFHTDDHIVPEFFLPPHEWTVRLAQFFGFPAPSIKLHESETGSYATDIVMSSTYKRWSLSDVISEACEQASAGSLQRTSAAEEVAFAVNTSSPPFELRERFRVVKNDEQQDCFGWFMGRRVRASKAGPSFRDGSSERPRRFGRKQSMHLSDATIKLNRMAIKREKSFRDRTSRGWFISGRLRQRRPLTSMDGMRIVFFEKLFFQVDSDSNGYLLMHDMDRLLQFLSHDTDRVERARVLESLDDECDGLVQAHPLWDPTPTAHPKPVGLNLESWVSWQLAVLSSSRDRGCDWTARRVHRGPHPPLLARAVRAARMRN